MKQIVFAILLCLAFIAQDVMGQSVRSFDVRTMQAQAIGGAEGARGFTSVRGTGSRFVSATDEGYAVYETMTADETHFEVKIDDVQGPHWYSDVVISLRSTTADNSDAVSVAVNTQGRITSFKRQGGSISRSLSVASINMPGQVRLVYDRGTDEVAIEYRTENGNWIEKDTHTLNVGTTPIAAVFPRNRGIGPTLDVEAVANIRNIALRNPNATQSFVYDQECIDSFDAHRLHDFQESYGTLTPGFLDIGIPADSILIQQNTTLINNAINEVGVPGGGTICLPKGQYYIQPDHLSQGAASIYIEYDNITLWGAGRNDNGQGTALYSRGDWAVVQGSVVRGNGIRIVGTTGNILPRSNIVLRDFELNGQSGHTGYYAYPARTSDGDGWDITHKGIILGINQNTDSVILENIAVRSFKGEQIYYGGSRLGTIIVDNIISEDTNASTFNVDGDSIVVTNSEFGLSRFWVEIGMHHPDDYGYFGGNYFHSASEERAFVFAVGGGEYNKYIVENNIFEDCNFGNAPTGALFQFSGGVAGDILIENNIMSRCGGAYFTTAPTSTDPVNRDVVFRNNNIETIGGATFNFFTGVDNILIEYNTVTDLGDGFIPTFVFMGGPSKDNTIIRNNTVIGGRTPEVSYPFGSGDIRPLFVGNSYMDTETRSRATSGKIWISCCDDIDEPQIIDPIFEKTVLRAYQGSRDVVLSNAHHPDEMITMIEIEGDQYEMYFPADHPNHAWDTTIQLSPEDSLTVKYDAEITAWSVVEN